MSATKNPRHAQLFASAATWPNGAAEAWAAAQAPASLLSVPNARADWRDATEKGVQQAYGQWARWSINRQTLPADASFADRVTPDELEAYVGDLRMTTSDSTISTRLAFLKMALRSMAPQRDWAWLNKAISSVKRCATPVRRKRQRLVPMHELVALGYDLMEGASCRAGDIPSMEQATSYRNGLSVALLAVRPYRLKNSSNIIIGQNLVERDGGYWLFFQGSETKNDEELDQSVPEFLQEHVRFYLDWVRPVLAAGPYGKGRATNNHLWLTHLGSPLKSWGFYRAITAVTEARFGHPVNPHLFRDCLATTIANEDPDNVQLIKFALGHLRSTIADKYYIHAQSNLALTRIQKHVLELRAARPLDKPKNAGSAPVNYGSGSCVMRLPQAGAIAQIT